MRAATALSSGARFEVTVACAADLNRQLVKGDKASAGVLAVTGALQQSQTGAGGAALTDELLSMFAALILLTATGIAIFGLTSFIAWFSLHRWHESAIRREN